MAGRDVSIRIQYQELSVDLNIESGYQPDVFDDLCTRALAMFREAWEVTYTAEVIAGDADDDTDGAG